MSVFADALVLTGPTGSGKTAWAIQLAPRIGAEIVSMDSMTLYRGMDIGTAKPSAAEQTAVPHHLIDVLDPWESANVAWWLERAEQVCEAIRSRGHKPLFVGGTPFYLTALIHGLFAAPPADETIRKQLEAEIERDGAEVVHARLAAVDPAASRRIHLNDTRRIVRALEVYQLTGQPISSLQTTWDTPAFSPGYSESRPSSVRCIQFELPRDVLNERINRRVLAMLDAGWLEECRGLRSLDRPLSREARAALGYRELFAFLDDPTGDWATVVSTIQLKTRQFAKRQRTWFRRISATVLSVEDGDLQNRILNAWKMP